MFYQEEGQSRNQTDYTKMDQMPRIPIFHIFSSCVLNFTVVFITTKIPSCREEWFLSGGFMEVSIVATGLSLNSFAVENLWTCCGIFRHAVSGIQRPLMLPTSQLDVPLTWCQRVVRFRRHVGGQHPWAGQHQMTVVFQACALISSKCQVFAFGPAFPTRFQTR